MLLMLAVNAEAGPFKYQLLGANTHLDAIATGRNGTHLIFHDFYNHLYYELIGFNNKVAATELLPPEISEVIALAIDSQNQPHILYLKSAATQQLSYATFSNTSWSTQVVPNPGCGPEFAATTNHLIGSIAVDASQRVYIPCVWDAGGGLNVASLIIFDGNGWTREDAATARIDPTTHANLTPLGPAFAAADATGAVHLGYELAGEVSSFGAKPFGICDTIRQQTGYTERCGNFGQGLNQLESMAIGPAGDPHFLFDSPTYEMYYTHFDGSSWRLRIAGITWSRARSGRRLGRYPEDRLLRGISARTRALLRRTDINGMASPGYRQRIGDH